jgi:hypothetical protein
MQTKSPQSPPGISLGHNLRLLRLQTLSAFGFEILAVILAFTAHPKGTTVAAPVLAIGLVLLLAGVFGLVVAARKARQGR